MIEVVRRALQAVGELALPTSCGGCGAPGAGWCAGCARGADRTAYPGGPRMVTPAPCPVGYPPTWACTPYDAAVRVALVAFKDGDRRDLVTVLAPMLAAAVTAALAGAPGCRNVLASGAGPVFVVPVPSSPSAVRRRGDAPLVLLTRVAMRQTRLASGTFVLAPALTLRRRVADQRGLTRAQRAVNLAQAMEVQPRWRSGVRGATCLVVDDVLTTGATLTEASRALHAAGAAHVAAATVAATQRRGPSVGRRDLPGPGLASQGRA